jgi:hypothetical protein
MQKINALVLVELKKLYRAPMNLGVMVLMPVGLTLIFYFALGNVYNDYYPVPGMNHFEYLLPGVMGYAVIYMGMMVALALVEYRQTGLLRRVEVTPTSTATYLGSQIIANMIIATLQGLIVLLVARLLAPGSGVPVGVGSDRGRLGFDHRCGGQRYRRSEWHCGDFHRADDDVRGALGGLQRDYPHDCQIYA